MKYPELQAREISPLDDIVIPTYAQGGQTPPLAVLEHNRQTEIRINAARREWQLRCLHKLISQEEIGEIELEHLGDEQAILAALLAKLDVTKLNLVLRPILSKGLIAPELNPEQDAQKIKLDARHAADRLSFDYDGITIGIFEVQYELNGSVKLEVAIRD